MGKLEEYDTKTLMLLLMFGGNASSKKLNSMENELRLPFSIRTHLRRLESQGTVESVRPFAPMDLELYWRVLSHAIT